MLSLEGLQRTIARSVLGLPSFGLSPLVAQGRSDPYGRLRVYQNNTRASLTTTLMAVFPVTMQLVDERFFRYVASEFVRHHPPREARLVRYGKEFPDFLRAFSGLEEMPFVADTARLEWAIAEALDAPVRSSCPVSALDGVAENVTPELILQPSLRLVISGAPILSIWAAHQNGAGAENMPALERRSERVALWRHGDSVRFARLDGAAFSFRYALKAGLGLDAAVSRALTHDPMFDLARALVSLFGDGLVTHVRFDTQPH